MDPTKRIEVKGLPKVNKSTNHFLASVKHLTAWNNLQPKTAELPKLFTVFLGSLHNIRFENLNITEFNSVSNRADLYYVLIMLSLGFIGRSSRAKVLHYFNITHKMTPLITQLIDGGYIANIQVKRHHIIQGRKLERIMPEIELTVKGYKLLNHIFGLLIDERLLK